MDDLYIRQLQPSSDVEEVKYYMKAFLFLAVPLDERRNRQLIETVPKDLLFCARGRVMCLAHVTRVIYVNYLGNIHNCQSCNCISHILYIRRHVSAVLYIGLCDISCII